jgi:ribonuclease HI
MNSNNIYNDNNNDNNNNDNNDNNNNDNNDNKTTDIYSLYFDGCSKGNPGKAGAGAVIYKNGIEIWSSYKHIGNNKTNNEAEYSGLLLGLEESVNQNIQSLLVYGDSQLVINQVNGIYKVKNINLLTFYNNVMKLKQNFINITFNHVYRTNNKRADELSNMALLNI